jgi:hypothetical protein
MPLREADEWCPIQEDADWRVIKLKRDRLAT